jgi:exopolysaccharide production protein ExoZ
VTTQPVRLSTGTRAADGHLHGLDLLRVIASCLVVVTHIASWFTTRGHPWALVESANEEVVEPLRLSPNLSLFGVALFLIISGVVVTHVADREGPGQFLWRRLVRILPVLFAATFVAWCLVNLGLNLAWSGERSLTPGDLLATMTLAGFFMDPQVVLIGVTWTLLVQIAFYAYVALTIPFLRRHPWMPSAAAVVLVYVVLSLTSGTHSKPVHQIGVIAAYLPLLCIGQLMSLVRAGKVTPIAATAVGSMHFLLFVWADRIGGYTTTSDPGSRTIMLAVLVTLLLMRVNGPVSRSGLIKAWSRRTYTIYLVHQVTMYPILDLMVPRVGPARRALGGGVRDRGAASVRRDAGHPLVPQPPASSLTS